MMAALALLVGLMIPLGMWGQTVSVNDVLWTEPFQGTNTSNTFSATSSWTNYINPTTIVSTDASSLVYTSSNAMLSSTSSTNMDGAHVWLNKSVDSYIQISGIKLYNTTKVKISWAQATSGSSTTVYYQFDGTGDFTSLSTCSGPNANFESSELSVANHTTIALKFFHPSTNAKNTRIDNLTLTATAVESGAPSITVSDVNLAWDATSGSFSPAPSVSNPVTGGSLTASTNSDWLTVNASTYALSCTANPNYYARTATVTFTYTYNTNQTVTESATVTQAGNPTGHGSESDPLSVAEARAIIEPLANNSQTTETYYVTGIVSAIPTAWDPDHSNITFNIVDNQGDSNFLQAYRCVSTTGNDASTVVVGDIVIVSGNLKKYNTTYEFNAGCELVSLTHPTTPTITVTPATLSGFTYEEGNGPSTVKTLTVSGSNLTHDITIAMNDGQNSAFELSLSENSGYSHTLTLTQTSGTVAGTTVYVRMKAGLQVLTGGYADDIEITSEDATSVTVALSGTVTEPEPPHVTWDLSIASYDPITDPDIVTWSSAYATMTNSSENGGTTASNYLGGDSNNRTSSRFYQNNEWSLTPTSGYAITSVELTATSANYATAFVGSTWTNATAQANGTTVTVTPTDGSIAISAGIGGTCGFTSVTVYYTQHAVQSYNLTVSALSNVEIIVFDATNPVDNNWVYLFEGVGNAQVLEGTPIAISVSSNEGYTLASLMVNGINHVADVSGGVYTFTMPSENVTISATAVVRPLEATFIFNTDAGLQALGIEKPTSGSGTDLVEGHNYTLDDITMTCTHGTNTNTRVYNSSGSTDLRVYGGGSLTFTAPANYVITSITFTGSDKFGDWSGAESSHTFNASGTKKISTITVTFAMAKVILPDQWYLIASPIVNNVNPVDAGLITFNNTNESTYALYSFDQTESDEWRNYKAVVNGFDLVNGLGYLYANQTGCTLTFTGATPNGAYPIDCSLVYDDEADLPGYNLVGNPFATDAYLTDAERNFYVMSNGVVIAATAGSVIAPMQGIFVIAANADDDNVTFTTTAPDKAGSQIALNVTKNRGSVIDRAIVRMDEGRQLPKFQLFEDNTKVYIPQNGKDYAVVSAKGQGELPVNFRAAENGTYTLSIDAKDMDMNYLHLIDNMTGMDVDLLQTPSYTFEANVNDYESRFRLVFAGASEGSTTDESFAFYSNGNLIVNNEGNATLQVIDLTGRILSSETISGSCSTSINAPTGVYMLRLINGDNVKVQKIVVR